MATETLKMNVDDIAKLKSTLAENLMPDSNPASAAATRAEQAVDAVLNSITEVKNVMDSLTSPLSTTKLGTLKSYSTIVQQNAQAPAPNSAALLCAATKDRQILFDPALGQVLFAPKATSTEIATKVKQALMTTPSDDAPEINIKATTRLRNGRLIVELTLIAAANWVRRPENCLGIATALGVKTGAQGGWDLKGLASARVLCPLPKYVPLISE
ncbi:hypothetical protein BDR03DRAFT_1013709 [Suillus americanus]|nr:hypothetical protein BDR03DRAFT_1013709 [Suillus americanus]